MLRLWQKAYSVTDDEQDSNHNTLHDWQHGQGFKSVLALHLHFLMKCHNNMILNNQQVHPHPQAHEKRTAAMSWRQNEEDGKGAAHPIALHVRA